MQTLYYRITATAGDNVAAEIEYFDEAGEQVGFWAYGHYHPDYPFQGECDDGLVLRAMKDSQGGHPCLSP